MEPLITTLGDAAVFDQLVHHGLDSKAALPQASVVHVATKDAALQSGRAGAVMAFHVQMPDGTLRTAQATVTVRHLTTWLAMLRGRYGEDGFAPDMARN